MQACGLLYTYASSLRLASLFFSFASTLSTAWGRVLSSFSIRSARALSGIQSLLFFPSNGTSKPHRVYMRTPSFGNLQGLGPMIEGCLIADTIAAMGSMDFVLGDVDR